MMTYPTKPNETDKNLPVYRGKFVPLSDGSAELLLRLILGVKGGGELKVKPDDLPFPSKIVAKRIEALKLPIKFTNAALIAVSVFADNPGKAVLFLMDALNKFEGKTLTLDAICTDLYPFGFYDEVSLID